jgi:hypothetical protein
MPHARACAATLLVLAGAIGAGCRRHRALPVAAPAWAGDEEYCWWAVLRSPLRPDSVAARFAGAFTAVGLTGVAWTRSADTAWAHAGPTALRGAGGATYASRAVAYWHGDSTHFRSYVAVGPPPPTAQPQPADTLGRGTDRIALCAAIARAAAVRGSAPRSPTGDESLPVWTRVP